MELPSKPAPLKCNVLALAEGEEICGSVFTSRRGILSEFIFTMELAQQDEGSDGLLFLLDLHP
jgi:hypothetical protein